jgi:hypothetical protein
VRNPSIDDGGQTDEFGTDFNGLPVRRCFDNDFNGLSVRRNRPPSAYTKSDSQTRFVMIFKDCLSVAASILTSTDCLSVEIFLPQLV